MDDLRLLHTYTISEMKIKPTEQHEFWILGGEFQGSLLHIDFLQRDSTCIYIYICVCIIVYMNEQSRATAAKLKSGGWPLEVIQE